MGRDDIEDVSKSVKKIMSLYSDNTALGANLVSANGTGWDFECCHQYCDYNAGLNTGDRSNAFVRTHFKDRSNFKIKVANKLLELAR